MSTHNKIKTIASKEVMTQPKDLISDLPRDILESILQYLPIQEAVKTSILSKKWRYKWTTITRLVLYFDFLRYITDNGSLEKFGFQNIINTILHLYKGEALSIKIILPELFCNDSSKFDFDKLMLLLSRKGVKELILRHCSANNIISNNHDMKLPSQIFSCKDLRILHLFNFDFEPQYPPSSIYFKNLISISFEYIEISNDVFETIVSSALQLQTLIVSDLKGADHINVHAPKLRKMSLQGTFKKLSLSNLPNLESAWFSVSIKPDKYSVNKAQIAHWLQLKNLDFAHGSFQIFTAGLATKLMPMKFYHLKRLSLSYTKFETPNHFYDVVCLIKSSPNLHHLQIRCPSFKEGVVEPITKFMEVQDWGDCCLDQLRTVTMYRINFVDPELLLLKGLLCISPILEKIFIIYSYRVHKDEAVKFKAALEQAAPRVVVMHKLLGSFSYHS